MCQTPACRANLPDFQLSGAVGKPPLGGWKIQSVPEEAAGLSQAWSQHKGQPKNAKAAWLELMSFLAVNGVSSGEVSQAVIDLGVRQWCSAEPRRCAAKYRVKGAVKIQARFFPWAKAAWEGLNNALAEGTPEESLPSILSGQISKLTTLISPASATGCDHCHRHWQQVLDENPLPEPLTLDAARHWVVKVHNETREGREPVPYAVIAEKFLWSDPAPTP